MRYVFWLALILGWAVIGLGAYALAHDRHVQVDDQTLQWFKGLRNQNGFSCCDGTDGTKLEDPDWRMTDDGFEVKLEGEWRAVPPEAVLKASNRVGYAMVWIWNGRIACFMPGTGS